MGKGAGLSEDQTVAARKQADLGDNKLTALTKFASALHEKRGSVNDDDLAAFKSAGYDDGAVVEVIATAAMASYTNWFNHVNQTAVDLPTPPTV